MDAEPIEKVQLAQEEYERNTAYKNMQQYLGRKQQLMKAKHEHLERKKTFNKQNSFAAALDGGKGISGPAFETKSRLFDFEKNVPRSRRKLSLANPLPSPSSNQRTEPPTVRRNSSINRPIDLTGNKTQRHYIEVGGLNNGQSGQKIIDQLNMKSSVGRPHKPGRPNLVQSRQTLPSIDRLGPGPRKLHAIPNRGDRGDSIIAKKEGPIKSRPASTISESASSRRGSMIGSKLRLPVLGKRASNASTASQRRPTVTDPSGGSIDLLEEASQREHLRSLFDKAIKAVQDTDLYVSDVAVLDKGTGKKFSPPSVLDVAAFNDLQSIFDDARKNSDEHTHSLHDESTNQAQKKRIDHLEAVIKQFSHSQVKDLDPEEVLSCSYLRLTDANIKNLEDRIRKSGKEPGIHIHKDASTVDVFANLAKERADLRELEEIEASTESHPTVNDEPTAPVKRHSKTDEKLLE